MGKTRYIDRQSYDECQIVAAINASICLGQSPIRRGSAEYERLVDFAGARYGSAISIHRVLGYLRIWEQKTPLNLRAVRRALARGFPVGLSVRHPKIGGHAILIVDIVGQGSKVMVRVPNFRCATRGQWIYWYNLAAMVEESNGEFGASGGWAKGRWAHVFRVRSEFSKRRKHGG